MKEKIKIGIIRCRQTEDLCPGTTCLKVATKGKLAFADYGECEIVGFVTCGGCPGKRSIPRAKMLVERGAKVIAFSTCIFKGTPIAFVCPHAAQMRDAIRKAIGDDIAVLEYTH
ncbi:CGGC domain-containing protein [Bacteroidales bacterium OttesenSCG-928-B11]|nr:CGGC domain-containing protein [Bacteroidales bacterium OttesenSCG-928-E04]MDL2308701.1 CGGC domain-containing protein [Bacteroidales bacterium OttesenSCG-928-C03]MDL2311944.1 CGGC domain-containing protein [Bacteroidales bacterium OttesenSCG-928-B11]